MKGKGCISNLNALVLILSFVLFIGFSILGLPQEVYAVTSVKVGSFQSGTATGNVNVTGVGFQPKAVIFFWTRQTATGFSTGERIGEGFAAGSPIVNRGVTIACDDAVNPTNCGRRRSETYSIMFFSNGTPTLSGQGSVTSFNADGFTVNWNTVPGQSSYINYMAIGGDDITNVNAGTITAPMTPAGPGNYQSYTGVGFQPDFVMFLSSLTESLDTNSTHLLLNTGFMTPSGQAAISVGGQDNLSSTGHSWSQQRTDMATICMAAGGAQDWLASYSSMDADGFTLYFYDLPAADTPIFYLALKGGTYKVGSFTQPTSGTPPFTTDYTTVGFQPLGLFMASFNRITDSSIAAEGEISIGAASSSTERGTIWGETRNVIPSDANMSIMTDKAIRLATGTATTPTINAEADFSSFLSNGFRLNWTTRSDAIARQIVYWAIASNSTTVGIGTDPGFATIGPGGAATMLDAFTLNTAIGTDTVTDVTVTLAAGTSGGLNLVEITDNGGTTVYGSVSNPSSDTVAIPLGTNIPVTTTSIQYKVRITPKSHADMPAPPGSTYSVTGTVTGITSTNTKIYNDTWSPTITIDNQSTLNPTGFSGIPGVGGQVVLNWTNPGGFSEVVLLRNTSAISDTPVEGATYLQGNMIGTSTVIYVGNSNTFTDTGLTNGVPYYYKIFAKDAYGNYSSGGTAAGPYTPGLVVTASSEGTQIATIAVGSTAQYIGAAFTFQQIIGAPDTITALTISETGTAVANTKLTNVKVYYESGAASCSYDGTETSINTSFNASDKIVLSSISIPVTMSPNYTCVYVVFDVDASALNNTTVDLEITSSADFTLSGGITKAGSYPVALSGTTTISGPIVTLVKVGNFQSGTATGNVNVTGVGFQPQAVIFYWTRQTAPGFLAAETIGEGFAAGSPIVNRGVAIACDDNVATTNCGRRRSETYSIIFFSNGTPTLSGQGSVTSFDQDGFTVNWNSAPGQSSYINYIAIGGSVITNAKAGTITATTSTGAQAFTGVGFQPDFVMFLSGLTEGVNTNTSDMLLNTGFMTPAAQAAVSVCGRDAQSAVGHARSQQSTSYAIMGMTNACAQDWLAYYWSRGADGFTLYFSDAPAANTDIFYLALKGGTYKVGSFTQPTSGTPPFTQDTTTVGFQPLGLFMASFNRITDSSIAAEGEISIGAASSSTARGTIWGETRDIATPSDANMSIMTDKAIRLATTATINAEADFSTFLSNGFRLNWTTRADTIARQIVYWAIAGNSTTVGDGTNPGSVTIGPGAGATMLDAFTLQTAIGTDTVTGVTVTLAAGTSGGLSLVEITDNGGTTVYGSVSNPASDTVSIALGTNIPVTTTSIQYKVRITPKSHADMPAPPGSTYTVTGTVTGITSTNTKIYNDSWSAWITIDNQSTLNPTGFSGTPGEQLIILNWTNPGGFSEVVLLRNTTAISDTPTEGATYSQGNTIGTSTVRYVGNSNTFTDTGLTNGVPYYYKIFAKDAYGNYSTGVSATGEPYIPAPVVTVSSSGTQVATMNAGSTAQYIGAAFRFQQSSGTLDTISALTISETGTAIANTKLTNVKVYYESGVASCSYDGTETSINTSFNASDKIVLSSISIPVTMSPNYTCVYVVFDVDSTAVNNTTVDLQITSSADFTLSGGTLKDSLVSYPVALSGTTTISGPIVTLVKVGSFQSGTAAGNVNVTGVGFQPQAVIFYWTRQSATGFSTGMSIGEGFAVAGTPIVNRSVAGACDDNLSPTNCGRIRSETYSIMFLSNGTPTLSGRGSVTSLDPDGFTINWNTAPGQSSYINYMAIGGDAITDVKAGTITAATSPATQSYIGIGFQPDFVMFLSGLTEGVNATTTDMLLNTGFMTSSGQAAVSVCGRDAQSAVGHARSQQSTSYAIMGMTNACAQDWLASYSSMDSDGFSLYFYDLPAANTPIFYLALKGGTYKVGSFTQPTSGTPPFTQDTTTVGFQPLGLFMDSVNRASPTSIAAEGEISIGAASSSTERGTIWGETRDIINSDANMSIMTDKAIRLATTATINAEADFSTFLSNGFRLNWTTRSDAIAREIVYWAIASNSTTVGSGTDPGSVTLSPGAGATMLDAFTLNTAIGTDTVTGVTVTLAAGTSGGLSLVEITDNGGTTVYGSVSNPASDTVSITVTGMPTVTTSPIQYKVRITPKSHADMPAPPGSTYTVTGTVTGITSTNTKIYNDLWSAWITIDNASPSNPTGFSGIPSEGQVILNWTNPFFDFSQVVLLRNTTAITDIPVEGATYSQGNTIGTSTVRYVGSSNTFTDTGLTDGVPYYYKIFAKDSRGNYSTGVTAAPYPCIPGPVVNASSAGTQIPTIEAGSTAQYIGAAFTFRQSSGTADTITALTISEMGTTVANTKLTNVKVYYESGVASCSYDGTESLYNTSFNASDKIVLSSISIPVTMSPNYTCVYVVFDVDLSAVKDSTVDLQITSNADFTLSSVINKGVPYPVALSGTTTLKDTTAPGNVTNLTVTPGNGQVTFNWTNPSDADYTGVRIRRDTSGYPANCSSGTQIADVAAPGTTYTNTSLANGTTYFYRLCSYDETPNPNYSTGVTISATPSLAPVLSYPAAPYDDGKDPDTGDTTTDFTFKVIYSDWQNDPPDFTLGYPKIYIGDNDGYMTGYTMEADTSVPLNTPLRDNNYTNGEQYVYGPIGLGAATDLRFYFKAKAAGDLTVVYLPIDVLTGGYIVGPSVCLLPGYNVVGVPKNLGTGLSYGSVLGDDSGYSYCLYWDSYGLDITQDVFSGEFFYCTSGNIEHGTGYYIYALSGNPKTLDEPTGVGNVTAAYVDIALDPEGGWTLISNPYNARIEIQGDKVKIVRSATENTFEYAVTQGWIDNSIYEWEGSVSGYISKAYNGSPPAVLEPWVGDFIYVKDTTIPITLRVYKPVP